MKKLLLTTGACLLLCSVANAQQLEQARRSIEMQSPAVKKAVLKQVKLKADVSNPQEFNAEIATKHADIEKKYIAEETAKLVLTGYLEPEEIQPKEEKKELKTAPVEIKTEVPEEKTSFFNRLRRRFSK